jgi:hypothetical protein
MIYSFDIIDFSSCFDDTIDDQKNTTNTTTDNTNLEIKEQYDKTTSETYRIKRLYKIDPITDIEIGKDMIFEFKYKWNPYNGMRCELDNIGPLCFNALNLYDYYYMNRYKGLWVPPQDGFQGMYGDMVGCGKFGHVKSRGAHPEKYLFRLPIIDCYLPPTHSLSIVTMGPELTDQEISQIDLIVLKSHLKKSNSKFASLTMLKYYYDCALNPSPDPDSDEIKELKSKYPNLTPNEINQKYNRHYVDKLVNLKY